jgi:hypothetical protein
MSNFTPEQEAVGAKVTETLVDYFGRDVGLQIHALIAEQVNTLAEGVENVANFGLACAERGVDEAEYQATHAKVVGDFYVQTFAVIAECIVRSREFKRQ